MSRWREFLGTRWGGVVWWGTGCVSVYGLTVLFERLGWYR